MDEYEESVIERKALEAGMLFSSYMREAAMQHKVTVIPGIQDLYKQVMKVGNNLNQLTTLCHQGRITCPELGEVEEMFIHILEELHQIEVILSQS